MSDAGIFAARVALLLSLLPPAVARGQAVDDLRTMPVLRLDAGRIGNRFEIQAGGGAEIPVGYYTRIGVIALAGADVQQFAQDASGRLDVIARFLLDPFRQTRWGISAGAGVGLRVRARDRLRPYLVSVIDLEGPRSNRGIATGFQIGLGGGVRLGAALRRAAKDSR